LHIGVGFAAHGNLSGRFGLLKVSGRLATGNLSRRLFVVTSGLVVVGGMLHVCFLKLQSSTGLGGVSIGLGSRGGSFVVRHHSGTSVVGVVGGRVLAVRSKWL